VRINLEWCFEKLFFNNYLLLAALFLNKIKALANTVWQARWLANHCVKLHHLLWINLWRHPQLWWIRRGNGG
jgi:hypothetical protein